MSEWQPIKTAPRDGTRVLVYVAEYDGLESMQCVTSYHPDGGWCCCELRDTTHWMPLPSPPDERAMGRVG